MAALVVARHRTRALVVSAALARPFASTRPLPPAPPSQRPHGQPQRPGPVTWAGLGVMLTVGVGLTYYFVQERKKITERAQLGNRSIGKPRIGAPFNLVDQDGQARTDKDFLGKFPLIYFGFTFCPDICPEELNKMVEVVDKLDATASVGQGKVQPVFISVDPKRDTPQLMRDYLRDFSPKIVGLTGPTSEIARVAKGYRVYFSAAQMDDSDPKAAEYLVDHSVFFYLLDPEGHFLEYYGPQKTVAEIMDSVTRYVNEWRPSGRLAWEAAPAPTAGTNATAAAPATPVT